jgi:hypothetical protein
MEDKSGKFYKLKAFTLSFIKSFVISASVTFLCLVIGTVITVSYDKLSRDIQEFESDYCIAKDAVKIIHLKGIRRKLGKVFSSDNFLLNYIKGIEVTSFNRIKSKLPKDDLILDYMEFSIEKVPYPHLWYGQKEFDDYLVELLKKIKHKTSLIAVMNYKYKLSLIYNIILYISTVTCKEDMKMLDFMENYLLDLIQDNRSNLSSHKFYVDFILITTLSEIYKQRLLNAVGSFSANTCSDPLYVKFKNIILEAKSYVGTKIEVDKRDFTYDLIKYLEEEENTNRRLEEKYCKASRVTKGNVIRIR